MSKSLIITVLITAMLINTSGVYGFPKVKAKVETCPVEVPANWSETTPIITKEDPIVTWWESFKDPQLNGYIEDIVNHNLSLQSALARIREARALRGGAQSHLFPQVDFYGRYSNMRFSDNGVNPIGQISKSPGPKIFNIGNPTNLFELGFDTRWEIDLFGRERWAVIGAEERIEETIEQRRAALISLIAEMARNYIELRGAQHELAILRQNICLQEESYKITQAKFDIGLAAELEVVKSKTVLDSLRARIPDFEANIKSYAYRIAVLTGRQPDALLCDLLPEKPLPTPPNTIAAGLPAELVMRRPDIRVAQRKLNSTIADAGSARADLYPRIGINGKVGLESLKFQDLFKISSGLWTVTPYVNWRVFERKSIKANIDAMQARQMAADIELRETVLNALEDVESNFAFLESARCREVELQNELLSNERAYNIANNAFLAGIRTQLDVLEAQKTYINSQGQLVETQTGVILQTISLYKALGGGWQCF